MRRTLLQRLTRTLLRFIGRLLMRLLTRPELDGLERIPRRGPLLLVGNHVAVLEVVMLALYAGRDVELIGAGDIPLDARYAWLIRAYGYIPIKRGQMDRAPLEQALAVLNAGGAIGIFPEGGIWEASARQAKAGAAWLSAQSGARVVPIGFGGIDGALGAALSFRRPRVTMHVGEPLPPVNSEPGMHRKAALEAGANAIMNAVEALIPEADRLRWNAVQDERFELRVQAFQPDGTEVLLPESLAMTEGALLAKFFHRPVLLDVFARNLNLPVGALQHLDTVDDAAALLAAAESACGYVEANPHFLNYRFGLQQGTAMREGLCGLREAARWAAERGLRLRVIPIRRYRLRGSDAELVQERPAALDGH